MSTYDTGVERTLNNMHETLRHDVDDTQQHIARLRKELSTSAARGGNVSSSSSVARSGDSDDELNETRRTRGHESQDLTMHDVLQDNAVLRQKLRRTRKQAQRRETELETDLRRLREELSRVHHIGAHQPLERSKRVNHEPLRPSSRSSREEYLKTRRTQEALDQKLGRAMQEANDVAVRNDALMAENVQLRQEVARLRQENTDLLLFAKDSQTDSHVLRAQVVTNVAHRAQLLRRLGRTERDRHQLEGNLSSLAGRFVRGMQEDEYEQEMTRWSHIDTVSRTPRATAPRPARRPARTRNIRVEEWGGD